MDQLRVRRRRPPGRLARHGRPAAGVARRLVDAVRAPIAVGDEVIRTSISVGVAAAIGVLMLVIIGIASTFGVRFMTRRQTEY